MLVVGLLGQLVVVCLLLGQSELWEDLLVELCCCWWQLLLVVLALLWCWLGLC